MAEAPRSPNPVDQLVVVGASAGGVEALSVLVGALPADLPAAVVVAQHLDPSHPSHLAEILSRRSVLPVRLVDDRAPLASGTIYVVPANRHVEITDHTVRVRADATRRPTPSVDHLLATAAAVFGERLIAVILTGSGSDGAAGAHAVKEAGGTVIIQDPATAAFPSMPRALAAPLVDAVVPLAGIGPLLGDLLGGAPDVGGAETDPALPALLARVRDRRGIDFAAYKPPTIERRLRRRLAAVGVPTVDAYLAYLETHPEEEERLVADFLIKVTRFFRDPALFVRLREQVLPELVGAAATDGRELRLWSAGCATGEEAYSLAIIVAELLANRTDPPAVRIFATDLDETALVFARRGVYPASAVADVSPDVVARHFEARDGAYEARKALRNLIVFGGHDLAQRAPFPRTDLVLCRNVLIYFTPELQRRALEIFAYSLREGGYLVLGKAETVRPLDHVFTEADRRLRLYRREGPRPALPPARLPAGPPASVTRRPAAMEVALQQAERETRDAQLVGGRAEDLVRRLPVGVAVVDRRYDLEQINGVARELLGVHGLAIGQDLIHLAQRVPSTQLRNAIDAVAHGEPARRLPDIVTVETATGEARHLALTCYPDRVDANGVVVTVLVLVEDVTPLVTAQQSREEAETRARLLAEANRQLLTANRELTDALDQLRAQSDELRLATAAAQVSAEEIETLNEELQSTNEELETLHEEAQATVEELGVANEELQARTAETEELAATHAGERMRLAAVLASMTDAVVVVDFQGRLILSNAAYDALMQAGGGALHPEDEDGVPLPPEETPQARAAHGEVFRIDFTIATDDEPRRWYEATGQPLHEHDVGAGVVVIRDITDRSVRRLQGEFLSWAGHELRTPLTALRGYLQLAGRRMGPDGDPRLREYLRAAELQTNRQTALIEELVDATRLESGRLSLRPERLDLASLTARAIEVAQVLSPQHAVGLTADDGPIEVMGDAGRLEQVLLNLLTNAITYASGTDRIDVTLRRSGGEAEVAVRDYGPGIAPDRLEEIFARFVQGGRAEGGRAERGGAKGLGLGLYISREIVRAHGGTIAVTSALGDGATFTIRLPLAVEHSDAGDHPV